MMILETLRERRNYVSHSLRNYPKPTARRFVTLLFFACVFLLTSSALHAQSCTQGDTTVTSGTVSVHATGTITTSGTVTISNATNITFTAGTAIKLEPGFHAQSGSTFDAKIQSCTPTGSVTKEYIRLGNRVIAIENH
jgi:hypothetical protein